MMSEQAPAPVIATPPGVHPRGERLRRWVMLGVVVVAIAWVGRFVWLRLTLRPTPRPEYWAAQIAALDPPGPEGLDAATAYALLTKAPYDPSLRAGIRNDVTDILYGPWDRSRADIQAASRIFESASFREVRGEVEKALASGWAEGFIPTRTTIPRSFQAYKDWARHLLAHSRWVREEQGGAESAADDWRTACAIAREARRTRTMFAWLLSRGVEGQIAGEMMAAAREHATVPNIRQLADEILVLAGPRRKPGDDLQGERLCLHSMAEYLFIRDGGWLDVSEAATGLAWSPTAVRPSRAWNLLSPLFHDFETAKQRIDSTFEELDALVDLQCCKAWSDGMRYPPPSRIISAADGFATYGSSLARCVHIMLAARCFTEASLTMLVLEAFRAARGDYPESLAELVPDYLPRLPIDYADLQPLRYHRNGDDYVLYSIGLDGVDGGGHHARPQKETRKPHFDHDADVVFSDVRREKPWW